MFVKNEREIEVKNERTGKMEKVRVEGEMVPYSAFMTIKKKQGLNEITRYNLYPSASIQGAPAPGYSSGQAIQAIQEVAAQTLPHGYGIGWEGLAYDESRKGNETVYIFLIVIIVFVYLVLVEQYESFVLPLGVILSLPIVGFGSFIFLQVMGLANDVYAQIGMVMLVGQLGKNAILIFEFAVQRYYSRACPSRMQPSKKEEKFDESFRPIQMTSFALIVGLIPLVFATGAGAIGNRTIGSSAAGGMLVEHRSRSPGNSRPLLLVRRGGRRGANSSTTKRVNLSARFLNTKRPRRTTSKILITTHPKRTIWRATIRRTLTATLPRRTTNPGQAKAGLG